MLTPLEIVFLVSSDIWYSIDPVCVMFVLVSVNKMTRGRQPPDCGSTRQPSKSSAKHSFLPCTLVYSWDLFNISPFSNNIWSFYRFRLSVSFYFTIGGALFCSPSVPSPLISLFNAYLENSNHHLPSLVISTISSFESEASTRMIK